MKMAYVRDCGKATGALLVLGALSSPAQANDTLMKTTAARSKACQTARPETSGNAPDLNALRTARSEMREIIERYETDRESLSRKYPLDLSEAHSARKRRFYTDWVTALKRLDFATLSADDRIDYLLFQNHLQYQIRQLDLQTRAQEAVAPLMPFAPSLLALEEARERMEWIAEPEKVAALLNQTKAQIEKTRQQVEATLGDGKKRARWKPTVANRAAEAVGRLQKTLKHWFTFYHGYDPLFTWWTDQPYKEVDQALGSYAAFLKEKVAGIREDDTGDIIGDPIGREALLVELAYEMIPYSPEELMAIAEKELSWCEKEMKRAAKEMGLGDDWHKALEKVKNLHVEPGKQPQLIHDLAVEAIDYVEKHDLVTVPPLAKETWRMEMMSPERQKVNPFFLGGEVIQVSFPTDSMPHDLKQMSLRGNNRHFARATVQHELIPGHHLQMFMMERYRPYRRVFRTPFWIEGWALYWEMVLWDRGFAQSPEDRMGMLFWRSHRAARILFSLGFHLEKLTPQECIDMLVDRVGHERANATAEVRRSFKGDYEPLYQAAYLLGGLQIRALRRELVESGKMADRAFHDAILHENCIPIELLRARLTEQKLTPEFVSRWKFYGPISDKR